MIVTDGRSNGIKVDGPAQQLKNSGVIIFSVGIGNRVSLSELRVMASKPVDQHVFTLNYLTELEGLAEQMFPLICNGKCHAYKGDFNGGSGGENCNF